MSQKKGMKKISSPHQMMVVATILVEWVGPNQTPNTTLVERVGHNQTPNTTQNATQNNTEEAQTNKTVPLEIV